MSSHAKPSAPTEDPSERVTLSVVPSPDPTQLSQQASLRLNDGAARPVGTVEWDPATAPPKGSPFPKGPQWEQRAWHGWTCGLLLASVIGLNYSIQIAVTETI